MRKTKWIAAGILATVCLLGPQLNSALAQEALKIGVPTALTGTYAGILATKPCARSRLPPRKRMQRVASTVARSKSKSSTAKPSAKSPASRPRSLASEGCGILTRNDCVWRGSGHGPSARTLGRHLRVDDQQER